MDIGSFNILLKELKKVLTYDCKMNGSYKFKHYNYTISIAPNYGGVSGLNVILFDKKAKKHIGTYAIRKA